MIVPGAQRWPIRERLVHEDWTIIVTKHEPYSDEAAEIASTAGREGQLLLACPPVVIPLVHTVGALQCASKRWQRVVAATGGGVARDGRSAVILAGRVFVALGSHCFGLDLEDGSLKWDAQVDRASVFGLYASMNRLGLIVHGELSISRWSLDGKCLWNRSGEDVFFGDLTVGLEGIRVSDFSGRQYLFPE